MDAKSDDQTRRRIGTLRSHLAMEPTAASSAGPETIPRKLLHPKGQPCKAEYDYIVVGGGSAGCALAARLAEKLPLKSVLLVDAGGDESKQFRVRSPFITCPTLQNSDIDFAYRSTPQPLMQNRKSHWPRGKLLGGCSAINFMLAVRGDPRAYDKWASELGCPGWGWKDVEKYFLRMENFQGSPDLPNRGRHGPINITDNRSMEYVTRGTVESFIKGCNEIGVPEAKDYNQPGLHNWVAVSQTTIDNGKRHDTANAYLFGPNGAFERCSNLSCLGYEQVARVTFDTSVSPPRATGIELISGPKIRVREEVILTAGAVGTPQILMLSGLGPRAHLESKKIQVVADLPGIGQNLKDHLMVPNVYEMQPNVPSAFNPASLSHLLPQVANLFLLNRGVFTTCWVQSLAFMHSTLQEEHQPSDIQIHFVPMLALDEELNKINFGFDRELHEMPPKLDPMPPGITFLPSLLQPKSSGYIELASNDPRDHPIIEPRYFSHPDDIQVLAEAWKVCDKVANAPSMKRILKGHIPDDSVPFAPGSEEYIRRKVERDSVTIYHPTSTCKMGPESDPMSVLDPRTLEVRKIRGVRVADCSAMPEIPAGNTNLCVIMIGERCADLIAFGPVNA